MVTEDNGFLTILTHEASACAVCRCKTIFPLVGPYQALKTMSVKR